MTHRTASGFTLVETLIATGVLVAAIAGLAQLITLSARLTHESGQSEAALVAAQDKLEALRSLQFSYDHNGEPRSSAQLAASPATSLHENVSGYFEWIDARGDVAPYSSARYVRRWRIRDVDHDDPASIAIEVCIYDARARTTEPSRAAACLATLRVRQP